MISEKTIEQYVVSQADVFGGVAYKFVSPGRKNVPDRLVSLPGTHIFMIECKASGETPTSAQWRELDRFRARGVTVYVCDSQDSVDEAFGYALRFLQCHGRGPAIP